MSQDLMGYFSEVYEKHLAENPTPNEAPEVEAIRKCCIEEFIAVCRNKLKENPPNGVFPTPYGLGLRLTDLTEVNVAPLPEGAPPEGSAWMPITRPSTNPLQRGVEPTPVINITGEQK